MQAKEIVGNVDNLFGGRERLGSVLQEAANKGV